MRKLMSLGLASLFLAVTGCQDTSTTGPLAPDPAFHVGGAGHGSSSFAMLDDFAVETGASGSGTADWGFPPVQGSSVQISVDAEGLMANHDYELNVTIGRGNTFPPSSFVTFTATSDSDGKIKFEEDLDLVSTLGPGTYRLDFFVTHDHSTGTGVVFGLFDRDLLLRCAPFTLVTIV